MKRTAPLLTALWCVLITVALAADEPFRPEAGKFPALKKAHSYRGELVFVDHANRRGSLRVQGTGVFRRNDPHPFAMLPYGMVRYHGAPADLRDVPLGTVLHVQAFLPPDPKISAVPVLRLWAAAASRSVLRRTSSPKASARPESFASVPRTGPMSTCSGRNTSTVGTSATKTASRRQPSSPNTDAPRSWFFGDHGTTVFWSLEPSSSFG
ncbi:MAG: hypothetical protein QOE70_6205 [Chthoniobacter sp.]|nr:hypothetical protein [Chthoniobacter sp.]